jgi:YHS domain-containing protein
MKAYLLFGVLITFTLSSRAQSEEFRKSNFNVRRNIAIEGYDPVSYFSGKPVEGKPEHKFVYGGVIYYFSTPGNLSTFRSNPDQYEPAYGGWCAYAMGESGEKVKIDPETFKILNGKLYLFYNFWGNNTLTSWNKSERKLKDAADLNWKKITVKTD